jgi:hypothetical protein
MTTRDLATFSSSPLPSLLTTLHRLIQVHRPAFRQEHPFRLPTASLYFA